MGNVDRGFAADKLVEVAVQLAFGKRVKRCCRLVQYNYGRIFVKCSCKCKLLFFAAGEVNSVIVYYLQYLGRNTIRQLLQLVPQSRVNKAFFGKSLVGVLGRLHRNILAERKREQLNVLKYRGECAVIALLAVFLYVHAVQQYLTRRGLIQSQQQLYERGFSCAVEPHHRETFTRIYLYGQVFESISFRFRVPE